MRKLWIYIIPVIMAISEILLQLKAEAGFFSYVILIFGVLIVLSKTKEQNEESKILVVMMILPLIRVSTIFINEEFWNLLATLYILLFMAFIYIYKFKVNLGDIKNKLYLIPAALIMGAIFGLIGRGIISFEKEFLVILIVPFLSFSEELFFRGLIQNISSSYGKINSIIFTSLLFSVFSIYLGLGAFLFIFLVNLSICIVYGLTRNIVLCFVLNLAVTMLMFF